MITQLKEKVMKEVEGSMPCTPLPEDMYTDMSFPRIIKLMKFRTDRYSLEGYGKLMSMHTTTKMGMELLTLSFMPSSGLNVPYLLMDCMSVKDKRCVFVEYYGCGNKDLVHGALEEVHANYSSLPDYSEKDGWYIAEREPYSLIKSGTEDELVSMACDSVKAYLSMVPLAHEDSGYRAQLEAFRTRMTEEGNPSSSTMRLLLGRVGAERFMKAAVMPLDGETVPDMPDRRTMWKV